MFLAVCFVCSLQLADMQNMLFLSGKVRSLYFQRKKAANLAWTTTYRRAHKKDQTGEQAKRKRRNLHSKKPRAVAGVSLEVHFLAFRAFLLTEPAFLHH